MKITIFSIIFFAMSLVCFSQDFKADTTLASSYIKKAYDLKASRNYDSSTIYYEKAIVLYDKHQDWENTFNCKNFIAYNFVLARKFDRAMEIAEAVIKDSKIKLGENNIQIAHAYRVIGNVYSNTAKLDIALYYFKKCLKIRKKKLGENDTKVASTYSDIAIAYARKGDLGPAEENFRNALNVMIIAKGRVHRNVADCYNGLGNVLWFKSELDKALECFNHSLEIRIELYGTDHYNTAGSYYAIGNVYIEKGDFKLGKENLHKALELWNDELTPRVANAISAIGTANYDLGLYDEALSYYNEGLEVRKKVFQEGHPMFSSSYNNIGTVYERKGNYEKALMNYNLALEIQINAQGEFHPAVAGYYTNIGQIQSDLGNLDLALELYQKSLDLNIKRLGKDHPQVGDTYLSLGTVYKRKGDYSRALENLEKGKKIYIKSIGENHRNVGANYNIIGQVNEKLGNYDLAILNHKKSISILQKSFGEEHHDNLGTGYNDLASAYFLKGEFDFALENYEKGLKIYQKTLGEKHHKVANSYLLLAKVFNKQAKEEVALKYVQKAICANMTNFNDSINVNANPKLEDYGNQSILLATLQFKAELFAEKDKKEDLKFAIETFELCNELIVKNRLAIIKQSDKVELGKKADEIYKKAFNTSISLFEKTNNEDYLKKAFFFNENNKANVLSDILANNNAKRFAGIPDSLLEKEKDFKIDISFYQQKIAVKEDSLNLDIYKEKLFTLNRSYEALLNTFEKQFPKYHKLKYNKTVPNIESIQNSLPNDTEFIEYFDGDDVLYAFVISKEAFRLEKMPEMKNLERNIKAIPNLLKEENISEYVKVAYKLYEDLISPLNIKSKNLIIVPDKELWQLNFDLLLKDKPKELTYKQLPYIIKDHNISYGYSAKLLKYKDTDLNKSPKNECLAFSYNNAENVSTGNYIAMRGEGEINSELIDLPGTRKEIEAVSSVLSGAYYYGTFANERNFKANAKDYNILHLALHGVIDNEDPMNSRLFFTQDKDSVEDNYLHAYELYNLDLNAELAVLSACNTGSGKIVKGEGIMSLGRAFTYAGCKSLLLSQWDVSDAFTPGIMKDFYANLKEGKTKSASLREAKLAFLESADNLSANPYFWAPLVQLGDDRPLEQDNNLKWSILFVSVIAVLGLIIYKLRSANNN